MLHLSTIRQHYQMGFKSVLSLVEQFEHQIESLTLAQQSPSHISHLQKTVITQQNEIKRLSQIIENESQLLFKTEQGNYQSQQKLQNRLAKARNLNRELRTGIRELEEFIISETKFLNTFEKFLFLV